MRAESSPLLAATLQLAVPMWLERLRLSGGPTDTDWESVREFAHVLGSHGDLLLYRDKKAGGKKSKKAKPAATAAARPTAAELFNGLARAIAVMAHVPGGVTVFGQHFEANHEP